MAKDKASAEDIIRRMRESGAVYNLRGSDYAKLRADGVPDSVLDYMQRQQIEQARYEEWAAARDRWTWGPFGWRPYPYGPTFGPYGSPWGVPPPGVWPAPGAWPPPPR